MSIIERPTDGQQAADSQPVMASGSGRAQAHKCDLCHQRESGPACIEVCPTNALKLVTPGYWKPYSAKTVAGRTRQRTRYRPLTYDHKDKNEKILTVCPYCGSGCKLNLLVEDGEIVGAEPADGVTNQESCV